MYAYRAAEAFGMSPDSIVLPPDLPLPTIPDQPDGEDGLAPADRSIEEAQNFFNN